MGESMMTEAPATDKPRRFGSREFEYMREPGGRILFRRPGDEEWHALDVRMTNAELDAHLDERPHLREIPA